VRKSVGAENTFLSDLTEFEAMLSELQPLIDKVWRHCEDVHAGQIPGEWLPRLTLSWHVVAVASETITETNLPHHHVICLASGLGGSSALPFATR
jgi:nucleotidyltransferase/DNA polymerase involved in DNA repair